MAAQVTSVSVKNEIMAKLSENKTQEAKQLYELKGKHLNPSDRSFILSKAPALAPESLNSPAKQKNEIKQLPQDNKESTKATDKEVNSQQNKQASKAEISDAWDKMLQKECSGDANKLEWGHMDNFFASFGQDDGDEGSVEQFLNEKFGSTDPSDIKKQLSPQANKSDESKESDKHQASNIQQNSNNSAQSIYSTAVHKSQSPQVSFSKDELLNIKRVLVGVNNGGEKSPKAKVEKEKLSQEKHNDWTRSKNCASCVLAGIDRLSGKDTNAIASPSTKNESKPGKMITNFMMMAPDNLDISRDKAIATANKASELGAAINKNFVVDKPLVFLVTAQDVKSKEPGHVLLALMPAGKGEKALTFYDPQKETEANPILLDYQYKLIQAVPVCEIASDIISPKKK